MTNLTRKIYNWLGRPPAIVLPIAAAAPILIACALVGTAQDAAARGPATVLRNAEVISGIPNHPDILTGCAYGQRVWILDNGSHGDRGGITVNADPTCGPDGPVVVP